MQTIHPVKTENTSVTTLRLLGAAKEGARCAFQHDKNLGAVPFGA